MGFALKKALVQEFDAPEHLDAIKYNKMLGELVDIIEDFCGKHMDRGSSGEVLPSYSECHVARQFYHDAYLGLEHRPLVNPTREYINEVAVDEWIAQRLKTLTHENGRVHRCSAYKEDRPDRRCTNRTYSNGSLCDPCLEKGLQNKIGGLGDSRVAASLECLRTPNESQEIAA
jgi:hypothetical protein